MHFKQHFDIPADLTYLNTPGNGIIPRQVHDWRRQREVAFFDLKGSLRDQQADLVNSVRQTIASTFAAKSEQVFCTPNFSFGYSTLLDRLPRTYTFLLLNEDYPSLNYPIISRGFAFHSIDITHHVEEDILQAVKKYKPDVFILSLIQYITGVKIGLDFIKTLKATFPDLLIIGDGTQFFGTEPFTFQDAGFDAIGGSGYKWLLSGFGNGFMLLGDRLIELLETQLRDIPRPKEAMWANKSILQTFFEPGHQETLSHGTLRQSLAFLQSQGLENIQQHVQHLSHIAHEELNNRALLLPEVALREERSTLINIQVSPTRYAEFMEAGISCFPRGTGIRIGIHLYNTEDDIHRLLRIVDQH
ncbi:aminotransferase class V-fold PLP-dependent enzyme [Sphingobacterium oryzagri]|uniref:Aminotransferase class V-fold PLP-dependent enzyme n=1 Tax=Sphingobacterium oryzagri TaxID=3025669 RepID=A0ABY7WIG8_9SPHI|nr:aminotransferase class V-fold PLP-dependent enzyme [Sphingobacterium sp. KACC 22765]WDF69409.1 aminotransferase class V-fold PLP-dependent enzyme [Sphingobacterium sp. KACC 22765]